MNPQQIERRYLALLNSFNRKQWENYVLDAGHDLGASDEDIYRFVREHAAADEFDGRKAAVFSLIVIRDLVDRHPEVVRLRTRLDLDSRSRYRQSEDDSPRVVASRMRDDVVQLMHLRDELSRRQGFSSYVDLVFFSEELPLEWALSRVEEYVERHLPAVRDLIDRHGLSWSTWLRDLAGIGPPPRSYCPQSILNALVRRLGLAEILPRITLVASVDGFGFCRPLRIPSDVRIFINSRSSLKVLRTLYHEIGHALGHAANGEDGLYKTYTQVHDETMAVVGELVGLQIIQDDRTRTPVEELALLENVRCGISCLFEHALWKAPDRAEDLYCEHYGRLGFDIGEPEVWALDTFRSLDPVYNHNYVIARITAERTLEHLVGEFGEDHAEWGRWLLDTYYSPGRRTSLCEKTAGS